jgi:hypothetical protein
MWILRNLTDGHVARELMTSVTGMWHVVRGVAVSNLTSGGGVQTLLDLWDLAVDGEDWVCE